MGRRLLATLMLSVATVAIGAGPGIRPSPAFGSALPPQDRQHPATYVLELVM